MENTKAKRALEAVDTYRKLAVLKPIPKNEAEALRAVSDSKDSEPAFWDRVRYWGIRRAMNKDAQSNETSTVVSFGSGTWARARAFRTKAYFEKRGFAVTMTEPYTINLLIAWGENKQ